MEEVVAAGIRGGGGGGGGGEGELMVEAAGALVARGKEVVGLTEREGLLVEAEVLEREGAIEHECD